MKRVWTCRRTAVTMFGMLVLLTLGVLNKLDVSLAIVGCVGAICGANAFEAVKKPQGITE